VRLQIFGEHKRAPKFKSGAVSLLIRQILKEEGKKSDKISVILVDDDYLLEVNRRFLNHNYRTDVISFDLGENGTIDGEIYVSVDRANIQAKRYKVPNEKEVLRLIVHGVLHLSGWEDTTRSQKLRMRRRENMFIQAFYGKRRRG
jgi:probable rRNA maturation factor